MPRVEVGVAPLGGTGRGGADEAAGLLGHQGGDVDALGAPRRAAEESRQEVVELAGPGAAGTECAGHAYLSKRGPAACDRWSAAAVVVVSNGARGFIPESVRLMSDAVGGDGPELARLNPLPVSGCSRSPRMTHAGDEG
ncbi:hypothetical protein GCM10023201_45920 [Actinomycetospora corticicola]